MPQPYRRKVNANGDSSKKVILINNFLGGLAWGIGTLIGAALVFAILIPSLNLFKYVPVIGDIVSQVQQNTEESKGIKR